MLRDFVKMVESTCSQGHVYYLVEGCLRICRDNPDTLSHLQGVDGGREALETLTTLAVQWIESNLRADYATVIVNPEEADEIVALTRGHLHSTGRWPKPVASAIAARAWALALSATFGRELWDELIEDEYGKVLGPDQAVPVIDAPVKRIFGTLGTRPSRRSQNVDGVDWLRLLPRGDYRVRIFWDSTASFELQSSSRIGVGFPMKGLDDLDIRQSKGRFEHIGVRDKKKNREHLDTIVDEAARDNVQVLVLPELCTCEDSLDHIRKRRATMANPPLLVAGSRYFLVGGKYRNRAAIFLGSRIIHHDKNVPFETGDKVIEGIVTAPAELTIIVSERWSMSALICKDLVDERAFRLLSDLRVRLVLVPALSEDLTDFEVAATSIATIGQGITIIANAAQAPQAHVALLMTPEKHADPTRTLRHQIQIPSIRWWALHSAKLGGPEANVIRINEIQSE